MTDCSIKGGRRFSHKDSSVASAFILSAAEVTSAFRSMGNKVNQGGIGRILGGRSVRAGCNKMMYAGTVSRDGDEFHSSIAMHKHFITMMNAHLRAVMQKP